VREWVVRYLKVGDASNLDESLTRMQSLREWEETARGQPHVDLFEMLRHAVWLLSAIEREHAGALGSDPLVQWGRDEAVASSGRGAHSVEMWANNPLADEEGDR